MEREDWYLHGFDEKSALKIVQNGEGGHDFFINKDNVHLLTEQKYNRRLVPEIQYTRYEAGMVLIALAIIKVLGHGLGVLPYIYIYIYIIYI